MLPSREGWPKTGMVTRGPSGKDLGGYGERGWWTLAPWLWHGLSPHSVCKKSLNLLAALLPLLDSCPQECGRCLGEGTRLLLTKEGTVAKRSQEGNLGRKPFSSEIQHTLQPHWKALSVIGPYMSWCVHSHQVGVLSTMTAHSPGSLFWAPADADNPASKKRM